MEVRQIPVIKILR